MPIILHNSGINRKVKKVPFADLSGVQRQTKTGWLGRPDGISRKIFSSGIPVSFLDASITGMSNLSNGDFLSFNFKDPSAVSGNGDIQFKISLAPNTSVGAQLLHGSGITSLTKINNHGGSDGVDLFIRASTGTLLSYGFTPLDLESNQSGQYAFDYTCNQTVATPGTANYYILVVRFRWSGYSGLSIDTTVSIPWSAFTWLPTGETFEYQ